MKVTADCVLRVELPTSGKSHAQIAICESPDALRDLAATAARRRTEREAMEEALSLLAARDAQRDAMAEFIDWATAEWGSPNEAEQARADSIWANR